MQTSPVFDDYRRLPDLVALLSRKGMTEAERPPSWRQFPAGSGRCTRCEISGYDLAGFAFEQGDAGKRIFLTAGSCVGNTGMSNSFFDDPLAKCAELSFLSVISSDRGRMFSQLWLPAVLRAVPIAESTLEPRRKPQVCPGYWQEGCHAEVQEWRNRTLIAHLPVTSRDHRIRLGSWHLSQ